MTTSPDHNAGLPAAPRMTTEEVIARLTTCFSPLRCVPELLNDGERLDFRILDGDEQLMRAEGTFTDHLQTPKGFRDITGTARQMLQSRGYRLDSDE